MGKPHPLVASSTDHYVKPPLPPKRSRQLHPTPLEIRILLLAFTLALLVASPARAQTSADSSVVLLWTAPGDDGILGRATTYDIRYRTTFISGTDTLSWWNAATQVAGEPVPGISGATDSIRVRGLTPLTTFYFLIRAADEVPNWSGFSNLAAKTTSGDVTAPAPVANLAVTSRTANGITLQWTATGDDGTVGTASSYDIRYSTSLITTANWGSASQATGEPAPAPSGAQQTFLLGSLSGSQNYFVAIRALDDRGNPSAISTVVNATTLDVVAPAPVRDLSWLASDSFTLAWTAPGDDANSGRAAAYDLRYSDRPLSGQDTTSWWSAARAAGPLPPPQAAGSRESYAVTGLSNGTVYTFALRTTDEMANVSGFSNLFVRAVGSAAALATPTGFTAQSVAEGVALSWKEPEFGAGEGYHIYRRVGSNGADSLLHTATVGQTSWVDSSAIVGSTCEYRLAIYQGALEGTPAIVTVAAADAPSATAKAGIHGYPNPAREAVTLRFRGGTKDGAPGHARLVIYDVNGRRICTLIDADLPASDQTIQWACRSDKGNPIAPGIYNAILDSPLGRSVTRIAIVP